MGKRIRAQRIGRGSPTFKAAKRKFKLFYPSNLINSKKITTGIVRDLVHDRGRGVPIAIIETEYGDSFAISAIQGMYVGQKILMGEDVPIENANILPLEKIPEGTIVSSIEVNPGDGGKIARASGAYAMVIGKREDRVFLRLPSKKIIDVPSKSLAIVGAVASGGRIEKTFLKAGKKYYWMKAKGRPFPRVRGVAMAAAVHPFGGGSHKRPGGPTSIKRTAPPGQKVGLISPKRTGRKKGSQKTS